MVAEVPLLNIGLAHVHLTITPLMTIATEVILGVLGVTGCIERGFLSLPRHLAPNKGLRGHSPIRKLKKAVAVSETLCSESFPKKFDGSGIFFSDCRERDMLLLPEEL